MGLGLIFKQKHIHTLAIPRPYTLLRYCIGLDCVSWVGKASLSLTSRGFFLVVGMVAIGRHFYLLIIIDYCTTSQGKTIILHTLRNTIVLWLQLKELDFNTNLH